MILCPIHDDARSHWFLITVDLHTNVITSYDSLISDSAANAAQRLAIEKLILKARPTFVCSKSENVSSPEQEEYSSQCYSYFYFISCDYGTDDTCLDDCGVFVCMHVIDLCFGAQGNWWEHTDRCRMFIAQTILDGKVQGLPVPRKPDQPKRNKKPK